MITGPAVWIGAVLLVGAVAAASLLTYIFCRRELQREVLSLRRLLDERLAAIAAAMAAPAASDLLTLRAEAAPRPVVNGMPVRVRIRKRTPGVVAPEDAAVIAATALSVARGDAFADINAVAAARDGASNWAQQGRALVHSGHNVQYPHSRQGAMSLAGGNGHGEGRSEAAD